MWHVLPRPSGTGHPARAPPAQLRAAGFGRTQNAVENTGKDRVDLSDVGTAVSDQV
jgi:hypothetical protein